MRPDVTRRLKIFFVSTGIFLFVAAIADHLVLPGLVGNRTSHGLLFPPGSEFPYQTPEFSHTAKINSLGFRDREWATTKKEATTRIVAIGDSFTFGMGVELDRTWTKVLEQGLKDLGFDVEIANLGRPGAHPASYAEVAQKAVPLLKPDVLLVAVLQGDDLAQTIRQITAERTVKKNSPINSFGFPVKQAVHALYPNISRMMHQYLANKSTFRSKARLLENIWKEQAERLVAGLKDEKKARFESMGLTAREMFLRGHLNPGIVSMAIADPEYFATPLQTDNPLVKSALGKMQGHLLNMKKTAGAAEMIVLSIPLGIYVSENVRQGGDEIGFTTFPEMLLTTKPDESLKKICDESGIAFLSVTEAFRRQSRIEPLYYTYDGHFTPQGHELFVRELLPLLQKQLFAKEGG